MLENKSSTLDKIREVNPGGVSDNILIFRLNRILTETTGQASSSLDSPTQKSPSELSETARQELGELLTQGQIQPESKQQLKQEYLSYYLNKFGLESPQNTLTKQQGTLAQLELFKQRIQRAEPTQKQFLSAASKQINTPEQQKKTFIKTIVDNIVTKGKELGNHIRGYDVNGYKTQLRLQDSKQILSVERTNSQSTQPNPAFKAEKFDSKEFNILQDNLSQQEVKQITELAQQQRQSQSRFQGRKQQQKNNRPEIGD